MYYQQNNLQQTAVYTCLHSFAEQNRRNAVICAVIHVCLKKYLFLDFYPQCYVDPVFLKKLLLSILFPTRLTLPSLHVISPKKPCDLT